jgi:hypothetical protein
MWQNLNLQFLPFIAFCQVFFPAHFCFFCLAFYCLFSFFDLVFLSPFVFPFFFDLVFLSPFIFPFDKRRKDNKMLSKKSEKGRGKKTLTEDNKKEGIEDQGSST